MRGRKPKPVEIRELEGGSTVSHRPLPQPVLVQGRPLEPLAPPERLTEAQAAIWNDVVDTLFEAGILDRADGFMLEALVVNVDRAREASRMIEEYGAVAVTAKGVPCVSPWIRIERDAWNTVAKVAEHFGLTPLARTRLGLAVLQGRSLQAELSERLS